jgi:hypothetical protein
VARDSRDVGDTDLELVVRARRREWLDSFRDDWCPQLGESIHLENKDYQWRAFVTRYDLARAMARLALDLSWSNFKDATARPQHGLPDQKSRVALHDAYNSIWSTLLSAGDGTSFYDLPICERWGHYDPQHTGRCRDCGIKMPPPRKTRRKTAKTAKTVKGGV